MQGEELIERELNDLSLNLWIRRRDSRVNLYFLGSRASHACVVLPVRPMGPAKGSCGTATSAEAVAWFQGNKGRQVLNTIYRGCATSNLDFLTFRPIWFR